MALVTYIPDQTVAYDANGVRESGAKLTFYLYNTTTPTPVYQNPTGTASANPVLSLADGTWPEIYWQNTIRTRVIKTSPVGSTAPATWEVKDIGPTRIEALLPDLSNVDVTPEEAAAFRDAIIIPEYATKAAVEVATINASATYLRIAGYITAGDGGAGLYKKASGEPTHPGKILSADGAWWALVENWPLAQQLGGDVQDAIDFACSTEVNNVNIGGLTYTPLNVNIGTSLSLNRSALQISGTNTYTSEARSPTATPVFSCIPDTGIVGAVRGPIISSMVIRAQTAIKFNNKASAVSSTAMNFIQFWGLADLQILDNASKAGNGVELVKAFDGSLRSTVIQGFDVGLLMLGCDINLIENCRISFSNVCILEISTSTYGTQNTIKAMDLLAADDVYYRSCSRMVNFQDNYLEASVACTGFIDISSVDIPVFGANTLSQPLSIILKGNRLDGQSNATDYIYRIEDQAGGFRTLHLEGIRTAGNFATVPSYFCDASGTELDYINVFATAGRTRYVYIDEDTFGPDWNGYRVMPSPQPLGNGYVWNTQQIEAIIDGVGGATQLAKFRGKTLILPAGNANKIIGIRPGGTNEVVLGTNPYFADPIEYTIVFVARTTNGAGDDLTTQLGGLTNTGAGFGSATTSFTLTDQFTAYSFDHFGYVEAYQSVGFNIQSTTSVGDIEVSQISWAPK